MPEINLLPWREHARLRLKNRIRIFLGSVVFLILAASIFLYDRHPQSLPVAHSENAAPIHAEKDTQLNSQLQQLKFAGYLHQDQRSWGLIILPDGKTRDVRAGSLLDIGHARVLSVSESQIVLLLENHRQFVLKSQAFY